MARRDTHLWPAAPATGGALCRSPRQFPIQGLIPTRDARRMPPRRGGQSLSRGEQSDPSPGVFSRPRAFVQAQGRQRPSRKQGGEGKGRGLMMGMRGGPRWGRMNAGIASAVVLMLLVAFVVVPAAEQAGSSPGGVRSGVGSGSVLAGGGVWGLSGGLDDPVGMLGAAAAGPGASAGARVAAVRGRLRSGLTDLDAARAAKVDREAFPAQVARQVGGLPSLSRGQRVTRLLSAHVAQIALGHGERGAVESAQPMALETSPGHPAPVDLALRRVGGVFESVRPVVGVLIPSHAGEGVRLSDAGVSLTPVNARGGSLGGSEGAIDGASLIYANTQTDEDTLVKPTTTGFSMDAILRSIDSPRQLYYRVGLPSGARLLQSQPGTPVRVVSDGVTLGLLMPPTAVDATGANVPATMSVLDGDLLSVSVQDVSGEVLPISVQPGICHHRRSKPDGGCVPR